jgi:hypothetical protein
MGMVHRKYKDKSYLGLQLSITGWSWKNVMKKRRWPMSGLRKHLRESHHLDDLGIVGRIILQ